MFLGGQDQGGGGRRRSPFFATKKVGLLGSTESLRDAPWADRSWTLAAHPCCRPQCKREPDWYFDMHRPECFTTEQKPWNDAYYTWLKRLATPIFMQKAWPEIPQAVAYPFDRIEAEFSSSTIGQLFASNHCAYMIALAMTEGVEQIGLFGCQYATHTEHATQRESLIYWIGRFEQYGGRIVVPRSKNTLLMPRELYGYESHDEQGKLIPAYRPKAHVVTKGAKKIALVPPGSVPLAALPAGEVVALDRARRFLGETAWLAKQTSLSKTASVPTPPTKTGRTSARRSRLSPAPRRRTA